MSTRRRRLWMIILLLVLSLEATQAFAIQPFTGKVVSIADGDTITVLRGTEQVRIRFAGIDAPERSQAWGKNSRQTMAALVFGKEVQVRPTTSRKSYGRVIAEVFIDGRSVGTTMVASGNAWVYRKYSDDPHLIELETQARAERRGLWRLPNPIPPWEYRHTEHQH